MGKRAYTRNRRGQFAPKGAGRVTMGNAGGFAHAGHQAAVRRTMIQRARRRQIIRKTAKGAVVAVGIAAAIGGGVARSRL